MGSGVIYAIIIALWALYFIPRWLKRHEELSESRSVERFSDAMRILSRREPTTDRRYVVMPPRPAEPPEPGEPRRRRWRRSRVRRRTSLTVRRRRILAVLVLLTAGGAVAAPLSPLPWWTPVLLLGLSVADLAHLRLQERRRRDMERLRDSVRRRTRARLSRFDSAERIVEARADLARARAAQEEARRAAEEVAAAEAWAEEQRRAAEAAGWQPVPVPLPTYVSKPVASGGRGTIDLTVPGAWSAGQGSASAGPGVEDEAGLDDEPVFDQTLFTPDTASPVGLGRDAIDELDAIIDRRRAVND